MDCVFCDIVAGKTPANKVYEDDKVLAFLDILPINNGHTLVIPKKQYKNVEELPDKVLCDMIKVVKKIGAAFVKGLGVRGYNIQLNNGTAAGQIIPYVHFHVIPREKDDGLQNWPPKGYEEGEAEKVAKIISDNLK